MAGVPSELQGDTALAVTNWTDTPVCRFSLSPTGGSIRRDLDWLGKLHKLKPGQSQTYKIKPGSYMLWLEGCDQSFTAEQPVHIDGSAAIALGSAQQPAPDGFATVTPKLTGKFGAYVAPPPPASGSGSGSH